jgi:surface-anchored protein
MTRNAPLPRAVRCALFACGLLASVAPARAQLSSSYTEIDDVHADLCMAYVNGGWQTFVHTGNPGSFVGYQPNEALLIINTSTLTTRPAGSEYDFLGAAPGESVWIAPFNQVPGQIYLGVESDYGFNGVDRMLPRNDTNWKRWDPGNGVTSHYIEMEVVGFAGPGEMSVWQVNLGNPVVALDTADGLNSSASDQDEFRQLIRGHSHYNWGFTAPGRYELTLRARTFLGPNSGSGTELVSDPTTFFFEVRGAAAIPDAPPLGLLLCGCALALRARRGGGDTR